MNFNDTCKLFNSHLLEDFKEYLVDEVFPKYSFIELIDDFELWERIDNKKFDQNGKLISIITNCPTYNVQEDEINVFIHFYKLTGNGQENDVVIALDFDMEFNLQSIRGSKTTTEKSMQLRKVSDDLFQNENEFKMIIQNELMEKLNLRNENSKDGVLEIRIPKTFS